MPWAGGLSTLVSSGALLYHLQHDELANTMLPPTCHLSSERVEFSLFFKVLFVANSFYRVPWGSAQCNEPTTATLYVATG